MEVGEHVTDNKQKLAYHEKTRLQIDERQTISPTSFHNQTANDITLSIFQPINHYRGK